MNIRIRSWVLLLFCFFICVTVLYVFSSDLETNEFVKERNLNGLIQSEVIIISLAFLLMSIVSFYKNGWSDTIDLSYRYESDKKDGSLYKLEYLTFSGWHIINLNYFDEEEVEKIVKENKKRLKKARKELFFTITNYEYIKNRKCKDKIKNIIGMK